MSNWFTEKLKSRKLWVAVGTIIAVILGIPEGDIMPLVLMAASYVMGQGFVDGTNNKKR